MVILNLLFLLLQLLLGEELVLLEVLMQLLAQGSVVELSIFNANFGQGDLSFDEFKQFGQELLSVRADVADIPSSNMLLDELPVLAIHPEGLKEELVFLLPPSAEPKGLRLWFFLLQIIAPFFLFWLF